MEKTPAGIALQRSTKDVLAALRTAPQEGAAAVRACAGRRHQLEAALRAVEEQLEAARRAGLCIVGHGRAAPRADDLAAHGAEPVGHVDFAATARACLLYTSPSPRD